MIPILIVILFAVSTLLISLGLDQLICRRHMDRRKNEIMTSQNPIVLVDFDGVIHSYSSGWQGADVISDPPVEGAIDWLIAHLPVPDALGMSEPYKGPEVQIYSARSRQSGGIKAMKAWLVKYGVDEWYFRDDILKFPTQKPAAFLTIDDRAICFDGNFPTSEQILAFEPWNKLGVRGEKLGATGQFPDGKMNPEDEGELAIGVAHDQDNVIIKFGKPVAWLGLPRQHALKLAQTIAIHAQNLRL